MPSTDECLHTARGCVGPYAARRDASSGKLLMTLEGAGFLV